MGMVKRLGVWLFRRFFKMFRVILSVLGRIGAPARHQWLMLELDGALPDLPVARPRWVGRFMGPTPLSLWEVVTGLEAMAKDPDVKGVVVKLGNPDADWGPLWEVRQALAKVRAAGKQVWTWSESLDTQSLWLASAGDKIFLAPAGSVDLIGMRAELFSVKPLMTRLGVRGQFVQAGKYKSYGEMFTLDEPSPENREAVDTLLGDLYQQMVSDVEQGRGFNQGVMASHMQEGPYHAREALDRHLVDGLHFPDEVDTLLQDSAGGEEFLNLVSLHDYIYDLRTERRLSTPLMGRKVLALVGASGGIAGKGAGEGGIEQDTYMDIFDDLREDEEVVGVVLRMDSPGGSALTSDLLWRELRRLREKKPVYVSMGATAASGGYYLAAAGDRIFACPGTLTGSIGVLAGKMEASGLSSTLGVYVEGVEQGGRAGIYSPLRAFTPEERDHLQRDVDNAYDLFLDRILEGRPGPREDLHEVAQGRVWSGKRAVDLKLVDELGGIHQATQALAEKVGGSRDQFDVVAVVPPPSGGLLRRLASRGGLTTLVTQGVQHVLGKFWPSSPLRAWGADPRPGHHIQAIIPFSMKIR